MYSYIETKWALNNKKLILKSYPKAVQSKLHYFISEILDAPRELNTVGSPEELRHTNKELWSRELTRKDRIVYGIEPGANYGFPNEAEMIVFYQYLGHYDDK